MIKKFNDYDSTKSYGSGFEQLPKGGYVLVIKDAKVVPNKSGNGDHLEICADINEGEYFCYFLKDYQSQQAEDKKWRCKFWVNIPVDDGSEQDAWTKRRFKTFTEAVEDSNDGYHFDWDETKFNGKLIGGLFNEREWQGNDGAVRRSTNWGGVCAVDKIRDGSYKLPPDKLLPTVGKASAGASGGFLEIPDNVADELPFA